MPRRRITAFFTSSSLDSFPRFCFSPGLAASFGRDPGAAAPRGRFFCGKGPSRRPLRGLLRVRFLVSPRPEERPKGASRRASGKAARFGGTHPLWHHPAKASGRTHMAVSALTPIALLAVIVALGAVPAAAQQLPPQTLEELKAEAQARADRNGYPLIGLKPEEVREALARLRSLDRDEWAASWSLIGERYREKAQAELASAPDEADKDFVQAWRYYSFARWPVPNSAGKQQAYEKALGAFLAHGRLLDPPLEVLRIPFEGKAIVAYRQMPQPAPPAPVVVAIVGLDSR